MLLQNLTLLFSSSGGEYLGSPFGEFPLSFSFSVVLFTPALCSQLCHLLYFLSPSTLFSFGFFTPHSHVPFCLSSSAHHSISSMFGYGTKPTRTGQNFKGGGWLVWGHALICLFAVDFFFGCFFFKRFIWASMNPAHIHWTSRNPNTDFFFFCKKTMWGALSSKLVWWTACCSSTFMCTCYACILASHLCLEK